ncbi:MAG TPA: hypothetical protein VMW27_22865 [Thermoanaerobaculia bacterium]|nr:hypothetical protein [Thermoanaerobaculia bacterium]
MFPGSTRRLSSLAGLLALAGRSSGIGMDRACDLARDLLAFPPGQEEWTGGRSALNADGSPLQLSLSTTDAGQRWHLVADPAFFLAEPADRLATAREAAVRLFACGGAGELTELCRRSISYGPLWLAAGLDGAAKAVYVFAQPAPGEDTWDRVRAWLADVLPDPGPAYATVEALRGHARLAFVCLEGTDRSDARAKLYWRLTAPRSLAAMGVDLLRHPSFTSFLAACLEDKAIGLEGLVLSAGFRVATGEPCDAKVDVCGHCLDLPVGGWIDLIAGCARAFGLRPVPAADLLGAAPGPGAGVAALGLGLDSQGRHRLNLYLSSAGTA